MEKHTLEKRVLIDYLSVSIDFIGIQRVTNNYYEVIDNLDLYQKLIDLLGSDKKYNELQRIQPIRGYANAFGIGEHIMLLFGGEHTKNANEKYTLNIHMSGQACREFENFLGGNWQKLMEFLIEHEAKFKRLDIAIDDFDGQEMDIYDIEPLLRRKHFVSPFRKINYQFTEKYTSDSVISEGYTITLGSAGSNQLQIYDKRLERLAKDEPDLMTDIWYRYEMRFVNEKADSVAQIYTTSVKKNNSRAFMKYARELLLTCLDLKKYNPNNGQVSRWKTLPAWKAFLNAVEKIDLKVKHRVDTTIERKKAWYNRSIKKVNASFYASFDDHESFYQYVMKNILSGFDNFTEKDMSMINNYREKKGYKKINWEDIREAMKSIDEYLGENDE